MRPNIVFVIIESFDGRQLGFWGDPALARVTPNLDRIAREGAIFSNNYTSFPICCPARAIMWTGTYAFRHESWNNHKGLEPGTRRFQHVLEAEGYVFASKRGGIGKHDYVSGKHSMKAKVGAWTGPAGIQLPIWSNRTPKIIGEKVSITSKTNGMDWNSLRKAKRFLRHHARAQATSDDAAPFFLYLSLVLPHPPYSTHAKWIRNVDVDAITIPGQETYKHPVVEFQKVLKNWHHGFDDVTVRKTRSIYYGMLSEVDAIVGEVDKTMRDLGLHDDTYLVISADHGDNQLEHGQALKSNMFESAVKVPLVMRGPGIRAGSTCATPVDTTDLFPTFLDMAGLPTTGVKDKYHLDFDLDGQSLLSLVQDGPAQHARTKAHAFSMYTGIGTCTSQFMLREDEWKYVVFPGYEPLLFNIDQDPGELVNLAPDRPDVVQRMDARLRDIVDYDLVHQRHIEYCKASLKQFEQDCARGNVSFKKGKTLVRGARFEDVMRLVYKGWDESHAAKVKAFMA